MWNQYQAINKGKKILQIWISFLHTCSDTFVLAWPHCQLMHVCIHKPLNKSVRTLLFCFTPNTLITLDDYICLTKGQAQKVFFFPLVPTKVPALLPPLHYQQNPKCVTASLHPKCVSPLHLLPSSSTDSKRRLNKLPDTVHHILYKQSTEIFLLSD